jgi:hypothetical protein
MASLSLSINIFANVDEEVTQLTKMSICKIYVKNNRGGGNKIIFKYIKKFSFPLSETHKNRFF